MPRYWVFFSIYLRKACFWISFFDEFQNIEYRSFLLSLLLLLFFAICSNSSPSSFQISLIPVASKANSVGVLSNILLKTQFPKPAIAPKGPPYKNLLNYFESSLYQILYFLNSHWINSTYQWKVLQRLTRPLNQLQNENHLFRNFVGWFFQLIFRILLLKSIFFYKMGFSQ